MPSISILLVFVEISICVLGGVQANQAYCNVLLLPDNCLRSLLIS
jgi:hypothetical protein